MIADEVIHLVLTQYSLKKGMLLFGKEADESVVKEFTQLYGMDTIISVYREDLTRAQRRTALPIIMFLKRKRDGSPKGRICADGSVQRKIYEKVRSVVPHCGN